jgi:lipoprotein-anchoring transpeptidase ErfK/SrfK
MRAMIVTAAALSCALLGSGCAAPAVPVSPGPARQAAFVERSGALQQRWTTDVSEGVPAAAIAPLRQQLASSPFSSAPAPSPMWLSSDGHALLDSLDAGTTAAWSAATTAARESADAVIAGWAAMVAQYGTNVASADVATASTWAADLAEATTPAEIAALVTRWSAVLDAARSTAAAATALAAAVAPYGGIGGLEAAARSAVASAGAHHLDSGAVPSLLADLEARAARGTGVAPAVDALIGAVQSLRAVVGAYLHEGSQLAGLQQRINQASSMNTAHAATFPAQYGAIVAAYHAAVTGAAVNAVGGRINVLSAKVSADLNAAAAAARATLLATSGCGHAVPMGKVMVVSLSRQTAAFYDNTCLLSSTLVTTGRPGMRTPMGSFRIYSRASPAHFVSMFRPGSPGYYTPETTSFAMAYEGGGYYLHDAPWEPASAFGPGSQNGPYASHGCIHVPGPVMAWLFSWGSIGTRVIVTG